MTEIDTARIIKNAGKLPAGVCCRQAVSHSLFTLCRKGVMRMGNNRGTKALRFTICLVIVLAVAIALAPKAC